MMHTNTRATDRSGFSLVELLIVIFVLAAIAGLLLPALARAREEARRIRCRNNLNQLAKGMATYMGYGHGSDMQYYPYPLGRTLSRTTYNGAEWLAALYWTGVIPDPGVYLCPSTTDTNREGLDLGTEFQAATFGSQTVSYAGMHHYSLTDENGHATGEAMNENSPPPNRVMGSDDTQGDINHEGGMAVLFFDSHVEFRTNTELDLTRAVGQKGGLLEQLAN